MNYDDLSAGILSPIRGLIRPYRALLAAWITNPRRRLRTALSPRTILGSNTTWALDRCAIGSPLTSRAGSSMWPGWQTRKLGYQCRTRTRYNGFVGPMGAQDDLWVGVL